MPNDDVRIKLWQELDGEYQSSIVAALRNLKPGGEPDEPVGVLARGLFGVAADALAALTDQTCEVEERAIFGVLEAGCASVTIKRLPSVALPEGTVRPWSVVATREDESRVEGVSTPPNTLADGLDFVAQLLRAEKEGTD